jgi:5-methylcytosine-specific restriction protein A
VPGSGMSLKPGPAEKELSMVKRKKEQEPAPFAMDLDASDIRRERNEARDLRQSQWWKRRTAKGVCYYCGRPTPPSELTMDHIVPLARGGRSTKGNVVPACKACNNAKKQLLPMEWEAYLERVRGDGNPASQV